MSARHRRPERQKYAGSPPAEASWDPPLRRRRPRENGREAVALGVLMGVLFIAAFTSFMGPRPVSASASEIAQCPSSFWECDIEVAPDGPFVRGKRFRSTQLACTPGKALFRAEREAVRECLGAYEGQDRFGCYMSDYTCRIPGERGINSVL